MAGAQVLAGCSVGEDQEAKPAKGAPKQVAQVVAALDAATRRGDFKRICDELLTRGARRRAGGRECARLMRSTAREVQRPRIEVLSITVVPDGARVKVRTRARGQPALVDTLQLVRQGGKYRIEGLAG